jgi:hypothetical protein
VLVDKFLADAGVGLFVTGFEVSEGARGCAGLHGWVQGIVVSGTRFRWREVVRCAMRAKKNPAEPKPCGVRLLLDCVVISYCVLLCLR